MILTNITHIVLYRPYRSACNSPYESALFSDVREAMSFSGSHSRYCSTCEVLRVDFPLTEAILDTICKGQEVVL